MRQRTITTTIILAVCLPILFVGGIAFNLFALMVGVFALKEMLDIRDVKYPIPLMVKIITLASFIYFIVNMPINSENLYLLDYRNVAVIILLMLLPIIIYHDNRVYNINDALFLFGTIFFLGISFNLLLMLRAHSLMHVIYLLVITTMTDTYALISGKLIGKRKLLETISPKKTWEGLVFGTIFGVMIGSVFYYLTISDTINVVYLILFTTLLSLIGQMGDLVFSSIKRLYNKKDFSNLMPGHGGILDRLDSFIFVTLGYILLMMMI